MRSLIEFTVASAHGSAAEVLHNALVNEGIVVSEGTEKFTSGITEAMNELQRRTDEVYTSSATYQQSSESRVFALPADPKHPLICDIADRHADELAAEPTGGTLSTIVFHEVAQRRFLMRNVLAILAQTPASKRMLAEQLNVSVIHFGDTNCVGLMYWRKDRGSVIIRLRHRNPVILRKVSQLLLTTIKRIGCNVTGHPKQFTSTNSVVSNIRPAPLEFYFEPVLLFTHSVGEEEQVDKGEVVQFDTTRSTFSFVWRRRVEKIAKIAVYATAFLTVGLFLLQFWIAPHVDLLKLLDFGAQTFGRLFTAALWVIFLQIFVEHGALLEALRSKDTQFRGGAVILWGEAKRYSILM